ncbi:unnamed protein product [Paramecium pentaurelia]|uniref:PHD-type domain-containing protein n=1 Tax=Paramecium pentaurelia TaxID=43138 RepID=A0A8S1Y2I5_9CILI|nr:unnamed protein product [Paramecium pentaurelia]
MFPSYDDMQNREKIEEQYVLDPIPQEQEDKPIHQNPANNGKTYQQLFEIVQRLNDINWVEPSSKITPIKYLTPITYWFIICSQYFQNNVDPKIIKINQECHQIQEETARPYTYFDDWFIMEMRNITELEQQLLDTQLQVNTQIDAIQIEKSTLNIQNPPDYILKDLVGLTDIENQYLTYLESQQKYYDEQIINQTKSSNLAGTARKLQNVYNNCQICNQGVRSEDPLISCQKCQIVVHQKCYGLENAVNNWICDVCLNFGNKGRYLKCPLCPKLGGAMRPTSMSMKDSIFELINPTFHTYAINYKVDRQKPPPDGEENYNFMILQYQLENMSDEPPKAEKIWTHVSCSLWLDFDLVKVDKRKFNSLCSICKQKKNGACVSCSKSKCTISFHPECARRSQIYMESDNIYCFKHQPLKIKRIFEDQHNQWKEEIYSFFKQYEKLEQLLAHRPKNNDIEFQKFELKAQQEEIEADIKQENELLFQRIAEILEKDEKFIITFQQNQVVDIQLPLKRQSIYDIEENDRIWQQLANEKCSSEQVYILYQRAIRMRKKKKQGNAIIQLQMPSIQELPNRNRHSIYSRPKFFKYHKKQKQNGVSNNNISLKIKIPKEAINIQQQYCICKQQNDEEMMQCEICSEWYHLKCLGFLSSLEDAQNLYFYCFRCEQKLNREQTKYIKRYKQYFIDATFRDLKLKIGMSPHELRAHEKKNYKQLSK